MLIPIALFAYARPVLLARVLECLRANSVPLIYAFADGAKGVRDAASVAEARTLLRSIDWCEVRLTERKENLGLGRNVLAGVGDVAARHEAFVVWEDDLICVPGTYEWMCAALRHYVTDEEVMSVSAWTHPRVTPVDAATAPYFDGRADCWVWGAYARSWQGMAEETALQKMLATKRRGSSPDAYGADLPLMARTERRKNIWAVRWLYHHLAREKLCLRPPWSMVEHIGFDAAATNASLMNGWQNPLLRKVPPVPSEWPKPIEHPQCRELWVEANRTNSGVLCWKRAVRRLLPSRFVQAFVQRFFRVRWEGTYPNWAAAQAACEGYDSPKIVERVVMAARKVQAGQATYERDGIAFHGAAPWWTGTSILKEVAAARGDSLAVLDFGGSLGSLYFQVRSRLKPCTVVSWRVVEQPGFVDAGRREFQSCELKFYSSVSEACAGRLPDVLLLASVLPYLAAPLAVLRELLLFDPARVIIERTGFTCGGGTRLTVQRVPRSIYPVGYPCWFLDRAEVLALFGTQYQLDSEYRDEVETPNGLEFRTLHLSRRRA